MKLAYPMCREKVGAERRLRLKVLEPAQSSDMPGQTGEVVSLAEWSDPELTSLRPHEPEPTGVLIALEPSKH